MMGLSDTCWSVILKFVLVQKNDVALDSIISYGALSRFALLRACKAACGMNQVSVARCLFEASRCQSVADIPLSKHFVIDVRWFQIEQDALAKILFPAGYHS